MHVAGCAVFEGAPPAYEELVEADLSRGCTWFPATASGSRSCPWSQGRPVWVDDPHFNIALPRPPHRAARARAARTSSSGWPAGSSPRRWIAAARCGSCGWSRASPMIASPCSRRPTTRSSTGSRGSTSRPSCSTPPRTRCRWPPPDQEWVPRPAAQPRPAARPMRCSSAPRFRPRSPAACERRSAARGRSPAVSARPGGHGRHGPGGLAGRASEPVQRADRSPPAVHLGAGRPGGVQGDQERARGNGQRCRARRRRRCAGQLHAPPRSEHRRRSC